VQPTIAPFSLTATALIEQATLRVILPTTQAAQALGIGLTTETFTPTITPFGSLGTTPFFQAGQDCVYEVRAGDTMWNISRRFDMSVADITNPNGITNFNLIVIGDRLTIPGCGNSGYFPPATSTPIPSITPIGFGAPVVNDAAAAGAGAVIPQPVVCQSQYTVQQYDTLYSISVRFGVAIQSIVGANPDEIFNPERINMGATICIPSQ
jgi:LysM repeat protein